MTAVHGRELQHAQLLHQKLLNKLKSTKLVIEKIQDELGDILQKMLVAQTKKAVLMEDKEHFLKQSGKILNDDQVYLLLYKPAKNSRVYDEPTRERALQLYKNIGGLGYVNIIEHGIPLPATSTLRMELRRRREGRSNKRKMKMRPTPE